MLTPGVRSHSISSGCVPVLAGGAVIAAINVTMAALGLDTGTPAFMALLMAHLLVYLVVAAIVRARPVMSTNLALLCLAIGLLARLPLIALPEVSARDAIRYVWDARVQRARLNPYQVRPDDLEVTHVHSPLTRRVDAAWLPTIYPPAAQLYFRGVTAVSESLTASASGPCSVTRWLA